MLHGKAGTRADTCLMDRGPVNDGVRSGEIDVFKDAELFRSLVTVIRNRTDTILVKDKNFAGADAADKFCTNCVQCTALRGYDVDTVWSLAITKRAETVLVPDCNKLGR